MINAIQEADVIDVLSHVASQQTMSDVLFGAGKLPVQSIEERAALRRQRRAEHDAAVMKARGLLAGMGVAL